MSIDFSKEPTSCLTRAWRGQRLQQRHWVSKCCSARRRGQTFSPQLKRRGEGFSQDWSPSSAPEYVPQCFLAGSLLTFATVSVAAGESSTEEHFLRMNRTKHLWAGPKQLRFYWKVSRPHDLGCLDQTSVSEVKGSLTFIQVV